MILITGATGSNGTEIVKQLAARNIPFRAMVRHLDRARAIAEVVEGDFDHPETLLNALSGIDRAFLVTNSTVGAEARARLAQERSNNEKSRKDRKFTANNCLSRSHKS